MNTKTSGRLKMLGLLLFLFGLLTGLAMANFKNPRMGLAAHLEGILNGIFLIVSGIIWDELKIYGTLKKITCITLIYGTYINWATTLLAAYWGTSKLTPIAGEGFGGNIFHERIASAGFISVGLTMIFSLVVMIFGLIGKKSI